MIRVIQSGNDIYRGSSTCISVVHDLERSSNVFLFHEKQPHAKEKQNRDKAYSFRLQLH